MAEMDGLLPVAAEAINCGAHIIRTRQPEKFIAKGDCGPASNVDDEVERDLPH